MSDQDDRRDEPESVSASPAGAGTSTGALASRFQQMFPVLSPAEIDRVRRFGEIRRFRPASSSAGRERRSPRCT